MLSATGNPSSASIRYEGGCGCSGFEGAGKPDPPRTANSSCFCAYVNKWALGAIFASCSAGPYRSLRYWAGSSR